MTNIEKPFVSSPPNATAGKLDPILGRIDLAAILIALLGVCLMVATMTVMAVIELVKLISSFWASHNDRWLLLAFGLAIIWVAARWKRLCIF